MSFKGKGNNIAVDFKKKRFIKNKFIFLLSLKHAMVEKVLFLGQIFEMEILMDLYVLRCP